MVRELCKYRFRAAFGVWALWCGGAPFGRFPSRLRRWGAHLGGGGAAVDKLSRGERTGGGGLLCEGASAFAFALPHPALGASPISGRERGRRQVAAGRTHGQGRGWPCALPPLRTVIRHTSGMVRHCARGRPPLPSPPPPCARRRGTRGHNGADTPRERPTGERYIIIRVRRREGENVLHRAAGNDVDNFSVDNPLWITAAAGCRLLCGGRGRRCGGSVNADGEVQTQTGEV